MNSLHESQYKMVNVMFLRICGTYTNQSTLKKNLSFRRRYNIFKTIRGLNSVQLKNKLTELIVSRAIITVIENKK